MRIREILKENWGVEVYPNPIPMGDYAGPGEQYFLPPGNYKDVSYLYDEVEDLMDAGIRPNITTLNPKILLATQPFITNSTGDGDLYDEYADHPLIYDKNGKYYILDGHHRSAAAFKANRLIKVYLFSDEMARHPDRNDALYE